MKLEVKTSPCENQNLNVALNRDKEVKTNKTTTNKIELNNLNHFNKNCTKHEKANRSKWTRPCENN